MIITENQLDTWVRGNAISAQGIIVELVWRLVAASSPKPKDRRFPLGDSINQHGPDGILDVDLGFEHFVPEGKSFWEVGTGLDAHNKATSDYNGLAKDIPKDIRLKSTFIFVTPLSGRREWEYTWKPDAQADWLEKKRGEGNWKDVRVIDGSKLIDWLQAFPPVELWLAQKTSCQPAYGISTFEQHWELIRTIGSPPPLIPQIFLVGRDEASAKMEEVVAGIAAQLKLTTHYPNQIQDFIAAFIVNMDTEIRTDIAGRCLLISETKAWEAMCNQREKLILVADSALDLSSDIGVKMIQKAKRSGHTVIYGGPKGGIPDPASVHLKAPNIYQLQKALEDSGYKEERARTLARKSGGNLSSLLRCLQNLSVIPEWADGSPAAELAIAEILGGWVENSEADRTVIEGLSGNSYGEWIGEVRDIALRPGTPLILRDGKWKFIARYEGWFALGPRVFNEHLDRFKTAVISVLTERDPQFDLPKDKRFASAIYGKDFAHSRQLRVGLAESLALLGSHPEALTSCTQGKTIETTMLAVRDILCTNEWQRWAGLDSLLPLLAEAAPDEFLNRVESALDMTPCPLDELFIQEGDDVITGRTYISGLLWAIETLAWDANYLTRAVMVLGELSSRDPGGRWANRPANSLTKILLPWLPQTCASNSQKNAAISALITEHLDVGWKLLISLLPKSHSTSSGTRRPAWRNFIPDDWSSRVLIDEYWDQIESYIDLALVIAESDYVKIGELIDKLEDVPGYIQDKILAILDSVKVHALPDTEKLAIWNSLIDITTKHKKYAGADWAMRQNEIDKITAVAQRIKPDNPVLVYRRLFNEYDFKLFEKADSFESQREALDIKRREALKDVLISGGMQSVLEFSATVQHPRLVGILLSDIDNANIEEEILPLLLVDGPESLIQLAGGYIYGKFHSNSWPWVDGLKFSTWSLDQITQFLLHLPFEPETWKRAESLLGDSISYYWKKTNASPYETDSRNLEFAVNLLLNNKRLIKALDCVYKIVHDDIDFDIKLATRVLLDVLNTPSVHERIDSYETVEIIKALQNNKNTNLNDLLGIEWGYLKLLTCHNGASPKHLWQQLSNNPAYFCEVIQLVFKSKHNDESNAELDAGAKDIAHNAYELLNDWRLPPGLQEDGTFDGDSLSAWFNSMKDTCSATGHLEIAMTILGQSLIHTPSDNDGLWIHRAAAAILNSKDAEDMRNGFKVALYNSRGTYFADSTGAEERKLSQKYSSMADDIERAGYIRLAKTLREVGRTYEREAEQAVSKSYYDD
jgi:hypothetical protein